MYWYNSYSDQGATAWLSLWGIWSCTPTAKEMCFVHMHVQYYLSMCTYSTYLHFPSSFHNIESPSPLVLKEAEVVSQLYLNKKILKGCSTSSSEHTLKKILQGTNISNSPRQNITSTSSDFSFPSDMLIYDDSIFNLSENAPAKEHPTDAEVYKFLCS